MIGQQALLDKIDRMIETERFPRFSIVVGERGMEHEDVAKYVAYKMKCSIIVLPDVRVDTIRDMIAQAYKLHKPTVFCIPHADDMSVNAKNAILKVVEDAPNKAYFVMCLEDINNTLATIVSRGVELRMISCGAKDIYDYVKSLKPELKDIELYVNICDTPGDVQYFMSHDIHNFYNYAKYVVENMTQMSGAEVFKLSEKLALKDEDDKFDLRLFLKCLQILYIERTEYALAYQVGRYLEDLKIKGINKSMLVDNMILQVRKVWKSQK